MNKKFLSILTGVSALAVAGLLSIIPSSVSHAAPSQAPARVNTTIRVEDRRSGYAPNYASPRVTNVNCEFEYSYSGNATITDVHFDRDRFSFSVEDTNQTIQGECMLSANAGGFREGDTIGGTFRFTYDGLYYAASINDSVNPTCDGAGGNFFFNETGNYEVLPASPSASGAPASPSPSGTPTAPSENPGTPSDDPAAKEFNEAINNTVNEIELAILGLNADGTVNESKTVEYKCRGAISPKIIYALAHAENVTLIYTFEYEGIIFQSAITSEAAAAMYSPTIPWYGPCYIATFCPPIPIGFVQ